MNEQKLKLLEVLHKLENIDTEKLENEIEVVKKSIEEVIQELELLERRELESLNNQDTERSVITSKRKEKFEVQKSKRVKLEMKSWIFYSIISVVGVVLLALLALWLAK